MSVKKRPHYLLKTGFTLIELLVVVGVLGVLAAFLLANVAAARSRAVDARAKSDLRQLKTALRLYYNTWQQYPTGNGSNQIVGCGTAATATACTPGTQFARDGVVYMTQLPNNFQYYQPSGVDSFAAFVTLENTSDPDLAQSRTRCAIPAGVPATRYYVCND